MKLKDFNLTCPEVVLDEVFLINPHYQKVDPNLSIAEIAQRCGLDEARVIERLSSIESHSANVFLDRTAYTDALLLNFELDATPDTSAIAVHQSDFTEILALVKKSARVICLARDPERAFSAAIALRLRGYAHVSADLL